MTFIFSRRSLLDIARAMSYFSLLPSEVEQKIWRYYYTLCVLSPDSAGKYNQRAKTRKDNADIREEQRRIEWIVYRQTQQRKAVLSF